VVIASNRLIGPGLLCRYAAWCDASATENTWNSGPGPGQFTVTIDRWTNIPAEGSLVQRTGDPAVYLIRHGRKSMLLTPEVLTILLGRGWNEVQQVDDAKLAQIEDGAPLVPFWVTPPRPPFWPKGIGLSSTGLVLTAEVSSTGRR
jgi:hypothetical protein